MATKKNGAAAWRLQARQFEKKFARLTKEYAAGELSKREMEHACRALVLDAVYGPVNQRTGKRGTKARKIAII